jgi:hypothetical protein
VKKKARLSHLNATKTGGGPSSQQDLLPLEERLLALLTPVVIAGIPEIGEAGLGIDIIAPPNDLEISFEDLPVAVEVANENEEDQGDGSDKTDYHNILSDISYRSPIPKKKKTGTLEHIAQQHEECLRSLSSSNLTLAQSVLELATKLKRKRPISAALQFKF